MRLNQRDPIAVATKTSAAISQAELQLDFTGLLGSGVVFAAGDDPRLQAEMIDANATKIGTEGCCAPA